VGARTSQRTLCGEARKYFQYLHRNRGRMRSTYFEALRYEKTQVEFGSQQQFKDVPANVPANRESAELFCSRGAAHSSILMKRSAAKLVSCCTLPRGHRISMDWICFSEPRPKKTRLSLDEMNPTLTDT
jgi:hypothetical protein